MQIKYFNLLRRRHARCGRSFCLRRDVRQTKTANCALRKNHDFPSLSDSPRRDATLAQRARSEIFKLSLNIITTTMTSLPGGETHPVESDIRPGLWAKLCIAVTDDNSTASGITKNLKTR